MTAVDVRLATVDGSVTVKVSGRPFGGRVCATTDGGKVQQDAPRGVVPTHGTP